MTTIKTISIIGAGNVATHLGKALLKSGFTIHEVYSQSIEHARLLANDLKASAIDNIPSLNSNSDFYLVCINDDYIEEVVKQIVFTDKLIAHTSGSISMDVLKRFDKSGIYYPLQTFSKEVDVDITEVPFCIEANNSESELTLLNLAKLLSKNVYQINSEQRKKIHLAAVFACTFSNYMYTIADDILTQNKLDFDLLKPLIMETAKKIQTNQPKSVQTGPAKRNDAEVIKNHLEMLANSKDYQDIYKIITDNIIKDN